MSQNIENKENSATITALVAETEKTGSQYFRSKSTDENVARATVGETGKVSIKGQLRENNMLVEGSQLGQQFADEYRRIKRPLLSNAFGKSSSLLEKGNMILVTSSIPGEGKTHTAINLALSIAQERDHTVLLVDCDVTRQGSSHMLDVTDKPGLVDILDENSYSVGDVILRTDIPELCLIPAGTKHDFVTELLASKKMTDFVVEIAKRYDDRVIIFDGPPLLPTPEAQVLSGLVGQVVFVIEAGKTPQAIVEEALNMIPKEQAVGLVMNKSEGVSVGAGYHYGYYNEEAADS